MEDLTTDQQAQLTTLKTKLQNLGPKIKGIVEQGRLVATDVANLVLFKGMYKELKPYFDSFNTAWDKIIELTIKWGVPSIFPADKDATLQRNVERYYYEACSIYETHMNPTPSAGSTTTSAHASINESRTVRARLPQINLPSFNGTQVDWPLFKDTYTSLIHEESSLSDIEKFLFLVSCLKGPALALIKGIELQDANYAQAWELLNATYNDKRRLASNYLKPVLEFSPMKSRPTANALKHLLTNVIENIESLKQLKVPNGEDFILFCLILRCLDPDTRRSFEKKYSETEFPSCKNLIDFIKVEWRSLELSMDETSPLKPHGYQNSKPQPPNRGTRFQTALLVDNQADNSANPRKQHGSSDTRRQTCPVCKHQHTLYQCEQFRKASPTARISLLKGWSGCTNCLSAKHSRKNCTSQRRCQSCAKSHHTWLHIVQPQTESNQSAITTPATTSGVVLASHNKNQKGEVLLGTAIIEIKDARGIYVKVRAVTDSGSQHSFVTDTCAQRLGLDIDKCSQNVSGIGQAPLTGTIGVLTCSIRTRSTDFCVKPIVVRHITGNLPHVEVSSSLRALYASYVLADDEFWKPKPVEFLLGGDLFYEIITGRPVQITPNAPRLLPTIFGYVVAGPTQDIPSSRASSSLMVEGSEEMKPLMARFWELEEVPREKIVSSDERECEAHFTSTHYRLPCGRYVVSLPLSHSVHALINPRQQALNRLLSLESKLRRDETLKGEYHEFMHEYLTLGHMRLAPPGTSAYTIPHHAVMKLHNGARKLRVVFDASCSTGFGSLNDCMHSGPKLQLDISDVLSNFRLYKFVLTADIVKMYRQILVDPSDRKYQHIYWRFSPEDTIQSFELCTVTYGEKASAFLAQRTLKQLVHDEGFSYPLAARALLYDMYVDDIATGARTVQELHQLKEELVALLGKGKFELSKWSSNDPELLSTLHESELGGLNVRLNDELEPTIKVLGIQWNPREDVFSYEIHIPPWNPTKRAILSAIARIYDPLGFIAPVIFYAKTILQAMWIAKTGWDDPGPADICDKWHTFLDQLSLLSNVKIQRHFAVGEVAQYRIIGFSDASLQGYSAVLYLHAATATKHQTALLKAKTKLAPIKPITIPRLELLGTALLMRLFCSCKTLRNKLEITEAMFFTDSQIVLGWLATPPENLKPFVAHRVIEILENSKTSQWRHVPSIDNPADCSSRGILPSELLGHFLWWNGPPWLSSPEAEWPKSSSEPSRNLPEMKASAATALNAIDDSSTMLAWMERFSSYPKLLRSTSYALRFIDKLKRAPSTTGPITVAEYRRAEKSLLKIVQGLYKSSTGEIINSKGFRSLRPFVDGEGLVRVGGRLRHSKLPYDAKHPYLIPADCHFTTILVDHFHRAYLHLGPTALQTMLRGRYWMVGGRGLVRRRIFHCVTCYKAMNSPRIPVMGDLPSFRFEDGQVFRNVGVDFAGPFLIRESLRRKAAVGKAYLCVFVCMATKAVHLEVVSNCSTDAFLAAFSRFVARRGKPTNMYSDCGTNFIGAANQLRDIMICLRSNEAREAIMQHAVPYEIRWNFNPPSAPHFGGIWEAAVKSCKSILYKVIGESALTFEELSTLFCRIEGVLNSRPIAANESDPENADCLTPGHFLIGRPLTAIPEGQVPEKISPVRRWNLLQQKAQHFWARWRHEYLNILQQRKKWTKNIQNLNVGDLVIIKEPSSPMKTWPLARVLQTHAGRDGVVRVVSIKTATGVYKRPVAKLVPLDPVNEQGD